MGGRHDVLARYHGGSTGNGRFGLRDRLDHQWPGRARHHCRRLGPRHLAAPQNAIDQLKNGRSERIWPTSQTRPCVAPDRDRRSAPGATARLDRQCATEPASCRQLRNEPSGDRPDGLFCRAGANSVTRKIRTPRAMKARYRARDWFQLNGTRNPLVQHKSACRELAERSVTSLVRKPGCALARPRAPLAGCGGGYNRYDPPTVDTRNSASSTNGAPQIHRLSARLKTASSGLLKAERIFSATFSISFSPQNGSLTL